MVVYRFPVKGGLFGSLQSTMDSKAKKSAKMLNKNVPLRRFLAVPDVEAVQQATKTGGIIVCEGVPKTSNMIASVGTFLPNTDGTRSSSLSHVLCRFMPSI
jgi:hypothetical protein